MPELPEVETIRRELKASIINKTITGCKILRKDIIGYPSPAQFCKSITGEKILNVTRRAKYLIINLTNNKRIIFHLRLSGAITLKQYHDKQNRFTRIIINLEDCQLCFDEPRALGRAYLLSEKDNPGQLAGFSKMSFEPICPEYDFNYFSQKIKNRRTRIKQLLLDQSVCAGVGNIYSDEALFRAGIRPTRKANTLKVEEIFKLLIALKQVLKQGIDECGTTVSDYKRTDGKTGNFQQFLYVYGKESKPCRICGKKIKSVKIGNRTTRYCPTCQK